MSKRKRTAMRVKMAMKSEKKGSKKESHICFKLVNYSSGAAASQSYQDPYSMILHVFMVPCLYVSMDGHSVFAHTMLSY